MADDAGGKEVGRISIRVVPSLKKFFDDLKAGIEEAERAFEVHLKVTAKGFEEFRAEVRAETSDLPDAEVKVKPKLDSLDLFQKRMLAELNQIGKDTEPRIGLDVDGERLRRALAKEIAAMSKEVRAKIPVDLEVAADQRAKIAAEIEALKELTRTTPIQLKENPEADFSRRQQAAAQARKLAADLTAEERKRNSEILKGQATFHKAQLDEAKLKLNVELEPSTFEKALAEAKAAAKAAGVKINVDIADKAAEAHLAETIAKLKLEAKAAHIKLDVDVDSHKGLSPIGGGGGGFGLPNLGILTDQTALLAVAIVAFAAPALALITGLLVSLPAVIAGVALPIGVLALGFKGIGEAADAAGLLSSGKKGKQGIGPALKAIQDTLAAKFKDGFTPIFTKLAPLLPVVGNALLPIADRIVDVAKGLTDVFTSGQAIKQISGFISDVDKAIGNSVEGIKGFSSGLLGLISGVGQKLPGWADLFSQFGDRFKNWVDDISKSGELSAAMDHLQDAFKGVVDLVGQLGDDGLKLLADPEMGQAIKDFLADFKDIVHDSIPILKGVFVTIADLIHGAKLDWQAMFGDGSNQKPAAAPVPNPQDAHPNDPHAAGTPNAQGNNPKFGIGSSLLAAVNDAGTVVGQAAATLVGMLIQAVIEAADLVGQAGAKLVGFLLQGVVGAADTVGQAGVDLVTSLAQGIQTAASSVLDGALSTILTFFANLPERASQAWGQVVQGVQQAFSQIVSTVQSAGAQAVGEVASWPGKIAAALAGLFQAGLNAGTQLVQGFIQGIGSLVGAAVAKAKDLASQVTSAVQGALGIKSPSTVFHGIGVNTMQGLQNGLDGGLQGVLDRAKSISQQITDAMTNGTSGIGPGVQDQLKKSLSELGIEGDQLRVQLDQTTDKGQRKAIEDQLKQVKAQRDQLSLQSDQLGFSKKYGDSVDKNTQMMQGMVTKTAEIGKNFAETNVKQFIGDIGGSGNGAVEQVADIGIGWLSSMFGKAISGGLGGGDTHFHVGSVDEAMSADRTMKNRQALQFKDRS